MGDIIHGDHETQVSEGGEADLHKHLIRCTKNPGHTQFIPVDKFTLNHLPNGYRDKDLYELIKVSADLTVRVAVNMTSPQRPEFWPNTNISYPFYTMRGNSKQRTGSGIVSLVHECTGDSGNKYIKCWCKKCQHSDMASHIWWEIDVHTATHVVFDEIEASHTSLRMFFDTEESPVNNVDQITIVRVNIDSDWCVLKCVTCDKDLAEKLTRLCKHYHSDAWRKVLQNYEKSRDEHKLNFIVSHPHGCSKQVSVGHWVDKYEVDKYNNRFTYTTCTCPGSSGARVHCVGYGGGLWVHPLIHCGSIESKINYSGYGTA